MKFGLIFLISISVSSYGQLFSTVYKKYSADNSHYIISQPYSNQGYDTLGNTTIYSSTGEIKWRVERYFAMNSAFINNAGTILTFVTPFNHHYSKPISIYTKGGLLKAYHIDDLVDLETGYAKSSWMYESAFKGGIKDTIYVHSQGIIEINHYDSDSLEQVMDKRSYFTSGDSLFITTCEEKVFRFDLNGGKKEHVSDNCYKWFKSSKFTIDSVRTEPYETKFGREFGLPELENGKDFDVSLAEYLGFKNISTYELGTVKIKKGVRVDLYILVDSKGRPDILYIDLDDKELGEKISNYISNQTFTTKYNPGNTEKAYYFDIIHMDMKPKKRVK